MEIKNINTISLNGYKVKLFEIWENKVFKGRSTVPATIKDEDILSRVNKFKLYNKI